MELAKAYDKAEKETVEPYVFVTLEDSVTKEKLFRYDIPRDMFWKYEWVIRWRTAKLQIQRPRHRINQYLDFYDKKTGLDFGFGSLLSKLTSAKAQITILENKIAEYKKQKEQELFFDETTDPIISKLRCKIESQKSKQQEYEMSIKNKLKQINHEL